MAKQMNSEQMHALPEGSQRVLGRDAMRVNIAIGNAVATIVKSTLGPKGMDKMLVSDMGDIVITNDGATILDEMNVDHPAAKLMVEISKTQDKEVGDGTTTSVVMAGNLLWKAGELLDQSIHPTVIIKGYELASRKAEEILRNLSQPVRPDDEETLYKIALIAMGSKGIGSDYEKKTIARLVSSAVKQVSEERDGSYSVDMDLIKIEKKAGAEVSKSSLIKGVLIDKEVVNAGMPKSINSAKVLLLDTALEIEKTETDAKIEIDSPENMQAFLTQEENMMKNMVEKIGSTGANVVFCQKGVDDLVQHYLSKRGIMAVRRVKKSDMEKLSRATGGTVSSSLEGLSEEELGYAGLVEERKISGEAMVFVEQCADPKSVTLLVRGGTDHVVSEVERAVIDARGAVSSALEDGTYVVGGGSVEMEISKDIHSYAIEIGGREQLAIQAFADALEAIPKALAENAGMDVVDTLVTLRNKHKEVEGKTVGVNVIDAKVEDLRERGIYEPSRVKRQAISSATETARLVLRIDDIISSKGKSGGGEGPPGMPPGMGGMM